MDQKLGYIYCLFNIFRVGRAAERARRHPRETNTRNVTIWSGNCWEITSNSVQENILLYYNRKYFISTRIMLSFLSDPPLDSLPSSIQGTANLLKCRMCRYYYLFGLSQAYWVTLISNPLFPATSANAKLREALSVAPVPTSTYTRKKNIINECSIDLNNNFF